MNQAEATSIIQNEYGTDTEVLGTLTIGSQFYINWKYTDEPEDTYHTLQLY